MILRTLILLSFANIILSDISFIDRIAIIVDEGIIMESELNEALENTIKNFEESGERLPPEEILFSRVTERLIMDEILLQKGEKFGIRISDQELNESLVRYADEDGLSLQELKKKIESENNSFKDFRESLKKEMIIRRVQSGLVRPKIIVSDQELINYIDSAEGQNLISIEYKINQILLKNNSDEENQSKALEVINEINNGLSFSEATKKYSSLFNNGDNGNLSWRTKSNIPTLFVNHLKKMKKMEVYGPIKSGAGLHLLQLEDIRGETIQIESQTLVQHILIEESEIRSEKQAEDLINEIYKKLSSGEDLSILD